MGPRWIAATLLAAAGCGHPAPRPAAPDEAPRGPSPVVEIAGARSTTCARHADGHVTCWGGIGAVAPIHRVAGATDAVDLGVSQRQACVARADGTVWCWAWATDAPDDPPALRTQVAAAAQVPGVAGAVEVAVGETHACARTAAGAVLCWGDNRLGQLGRGDVGGASAEPVTVALPPVVALAAGMPHTCAALADPATDVSCWGGGGTGSLGDGVHPGAFTRGAPAPVGRLRDAGMPVAGLVASGNQTCAVLGPDGGLACWGNNRYRALGELADGDPTDWLPTLVATGDTPLAGVTAVATGDRHSCAALRDGSMACWGTDVDGELGDGATAADPRPTPVAVAGVTDVVGVAVGYAHSCALDAAGAVWCWGRNDYGQIDVTRAAQQLLAPTPIAFP